MAELTPGIIWLAATASLLLLVVSAFVSGSEIAFFSLGPADRATAPSAGLAPPAPRSSSSELSSLLLPSTLITCASKHARKVRAPSLLGRGGAPWV